MIKHKWHHRIEWTNWTFGIWWGYIGSKFYVGVDMGPFQVCRTSWWSFDV